MSKLFVIGVDANGDEIDFKNLIDDYIICCEEDNKKPFKDLQLGFDLEFLKLEDASHDITIDLDDLLDHVKTVFEHLEDENGMKIKVIVITDIFNFENHEYAINKLKSAFNYLEYALSDNASECVFGLSTFIVDNCVV